MAVNSFTENKLIIDTLSKHELNRNWSLKHKARETFERTPLIRLLSGTEHPIGKKKGRQTQDALGKVRTSP